jgi:hypothetical protein
MKLFKQNKYGDYIPPGGGIETPYYVKAGDLFKMILTTIFFFTAVPFILFSEIDRGLKYILLFTVIGIVIWRLVRFESQKERRYTVTEEELEWQRQKWEERQKDFY